MDTPLSTTVTPNSSGLAWWAVLLIVIGCVLLAVCGVLTYHFATKKYYKNNSIENAKLLETH